jgi:hypothetical protein
VSELIAQLERRKAQLWHDLAEQLEKDFAAFEVARPTVSLQIEKGESA